MLKNRGFLKAVFALLMLLLTIPFAVHTSLMINEPHVMWTILVPIFNVVMIFVSTFLEDEPEEFAVRLGFSVISSMLIYMCMDIASVGLSEPGIVWCSIVSLGTTAISVFETT